MLNLILQFKVQVRGDRQRVVYLDLHRILVEMIPLVFPGEDLLDRFNAVQLGAPLFVEPVRSTLDVFVLLVDERELQNCF